MKFAIEEACPRRWRNYNQPQHTKRPIDFSSLETACVRIGCTPVIKGKPAIAMERVLSAMPVDLEFSVMDVSIKHGIPYTSVQREIHHLIDKGYPIERTNKDAPGNARAYFIYRGQKNA